jgi:hypothetical protein
MALQQLPRLSTRQCAAAAKASAAGDGSSDTSVGDVSASGSSGDTGDGMTAESPSLRTLRRSLSVGSGVLDRSGEGMRGGGGGGKRMKRLGLSWMRKPHANKGF